MAKSGNGPDLSKGTGKENGNVRREVTPPGAGAGRPAPTGKARVVGEERANTAVTAGRKAAKASLEEPLVKVTGRVADLPAGLRPELVSVAVTVDEKPVGSFPLSRDGDYGFVAPRGRAKLRFETHGKAVTSRLASLDADFNAPSLYIPVTLDDGNLRLSLAKPGKVSLALLEEGLAEPAVTIRTPLPAEVKAHWTEVLQHTQPREVYGPRSDQPQGEADARTTALGLLLQLVCGALAARTSVPASDGRYPGDGKGTPKTWFDFRQLLTADDLPTQPVPDSRLFETATRLEAALALLGNGAAAHEEGEGHAAGEIGGRVARRTGVRLGGAVSAGEPARGGTRLRELFGVEEPGESADRAAEGTSTAKAKVFISNARKAIKACAGSEKAALLDDDSLEPFLNDYEYRFKVFPEGWVSFGIIAVYRQWWEPLGIEPGPLLKTMPLIPGYSTERTAEQSVTSTHRVERKRETSSTDSLSQKSESKSLENAVEKARSTAGFSTSATGKASIGVFSLQGTAAANGSTESGVQETKERIREHVRDAVQELQKTVSETELTETMTSSKEVWRETIDNPNTETPVTYEFQGLVRKYRTTEQLYKAIPVVLVGERMPAPCEVDEPWMRRYGWILSRVLLDESFRLALQDVQTGSLALREELRLRQKQLVNANDLLRKLKEELSKLTTSSEEVRQSIKDATDSITEEMAEPEPSKVSKGALAVLTGGLSLLADGSDENTEEAARYEQGELKDVLEDLKARQSDLALNVARARDAVANAEEGVSKAQIRFNQRKIRVRRLRIHILDNIVHYHQAIWAAEIPDQRYLRLCDVPAVTFKGRRSSLGRFDAYLKRGLQRLVPQYHGVSKLSQVCDPSTPIGYRGNLAVFEMNEHNAYTRNLAGLLCDDDSEAQDLAPLAGLSQELLEELLPKLRELVSRSGVPRDAANAAKELLERALERAKKSQTSELIKVPTKLPYVNACVGTTTVLDEFKQKHRQIDIEQAEQALEREKKENARRDALLTAGALGNPEIPNKVIVYTDKTPPIAMDPVDPVTDDGPVDPVNDDG
jgi:hypothetical protein